MYFFSISYLEYRLKAFMCFFRSSLTSRFICRYLAQLWCRILTLIFFYKYHLWLNICVELEVKIILTSKNNFENNYWYWKINLITFTKNKTMLISLASQLLILVYIKYIYFTLIFVQTKIKTLLFMYTILCFQLTFLMFEMRSL